MSSEKDDKSANTDATKSTVTTEKPTVSNEDLKILLADADVNEALGGEDFSPHLNILISSYASSSPCNQK